MHYLLDTNVLSEIAKPNAEPAVKAWVQAQSVLDLHTSVLVIGEIAKGIGLLTLGTRRTELEQWLKHDIPRQFANRIWDVDEAIAVEWGHLTTVGKVLGRELKVVDGLILATASIRKFTIVTRNEADFVERGVPVHNPWR